MKIMSPFASTDEVQPLVEAGAGELYCGVVPGDWAEKFTYTGSVNLRHDRAANLSSFEELQASAKIALKCNVPVFAAFNAHFYSKHQIPLILEQVDKAISSGASGLIIADPALLRAAAGKFPEAKISLSTAQPCFNSHSIQFFKGLGAKRIVLPRHLSAAEAASLAKSACSHGIETEAFALNSICPFIDGLCTFQHMVEPSQSLEVQPLACRLNYHVSAIGAAPESEKQIACSHVKLWSNALSYDCGLCAIPLFLRSGVSSVKIAGRANPLEKKLQDISAVKRAISLAKKLSAADFVEEATALYFSLYRRSCQCINCYCPDAGKWSR
ncbi:MAG: U32 family peptidase [Candidatus Diapherotrites archaeon]|uniref:U32 family peptidase n=1 Tax=Candidatus Iainarchaeum sp. TaxID=3101447 RepID=A0A939C8V5_9ARCH|nr:U32 family peptidase [Candidatus Diapherotrites archaeon]